MQELLADQVFVYSIMAILSFAITQGLKWAFVKPWTNKLKDGTESHERIRKAINSVIFLFPYAVGIALEILLSIYTKTTPNLLIGALNGGAGHSVYALYERLWAVATGKSDKKQSHAQTDEEKAAEDMVYGITEDNKINSDDCSKVTEFWNKVK